MKYLVLFFLVGCASSPYLDTKLVYQHNAGTDWMLQPEREWINTTNNPRIHIALGLEWEHQLDCPYIASGTDVLGWVHLGCAKTFGTYKPTRRFDFFGRIDVIHQVDRWSSGWLSTNRKDWQGHNPFIHFRIGLLWKHNVRCPVYATGKSIFQGFPFESENNNPDLYWSLFECGRRWGGYGR